MKPPRILNHSLLLLPWPATWSSSAIGTKGFTPLSVKRGSRRLLSHRYTKRHRLWSWERRIMAIVESAQERTGLGNYFVANYPPFSFWKPAHLPAARAALALPPRPETPLGLYLHIPF